jgi:branched-chain amino acid transport system permease protein
LRFLSPLSIAGEALVVEGLSKSFGGVKAVNDLHFVAEAGKVTGVIGPNGSGKTTLFNLISGYYKADQGEVRLGGARLTGVRPFQVARLGVARTFQTPIVPEGLSVQEVVSSAYAGRHSSGWVASTLGLPGYRQRRQAARSAARAAIAAVGLDCYADADAALLSLGSRRVVGLARVVAAGPRVVLLDEVASGLDEEDLAVVERIIRQSSQAGCTVLLVEHNFVFLGRVCDKVVAMAERSLIADGTPAEIQRNMEVRERYLGSGLRRRGTHPGLADVDGLT